MLRLLLLLSGFAATVVWAAEDQAQTTRRKLEQVQAEITGLQGRMQQTKGRYDTLRDELRQTETVISQLAKEIERLDADLHDKQARQQTLEQRHEQQQIHLIEQRRHLSRQIQAAYMMGREDYLKLLLNQQEPEKLGRLLTYYDYFNRARAQHIEAINISLEKLQILQAEIAQQTRLIAGLIANKDLRRQELEAEYQSRKQILSKLEKSLSGQTEALQRLQQDKRQLEDLLKRLRTATEELPPAGNENLPFSRLKGQLNYPVQGKVSQRFGDQRAAGGLKWQGWVFDAPREQPIRAVAAGRVVFADWFRNLGQLLIIDHGNGYMSLYAHTRTLYVKTGDEVAANARIATVGESGGSAQPSLYFEIRYQGNPINPAPWFKKG